MRPQEIIAIKRDGGIFTREQVTEFVRGVTDGSWADYQTSALIMAIFLKGLNQNEQSWLTQAMRYSGDVLEFANLGMPLADKHSTGGVGDKTSLIIAPLAAACGLAVPMISGRALGHTGGTLDKLESIAGYRVNLPLDEFKAVVSACGFAMNGQTGEIAPADKKLYALRDATATVPYIPLIVASIMSKKLAEGLDALILDVKTGNGAFMDDFDEAKKLAGEMVKTGNDCGVATEAVISDMSQPLGAYIGNALEVYECIKILRNEIVSSIQDTLDLSIELTARMLVLAKVAATVEDARVLCRQNLADGSALEKFRLNIELQGGDPGICDNPEVLLEKGILQIPITALKSGFISAIDTKAIGNAICEIGGGRIRMDDEIDHAVGFECSVKLGDEISEGDSIGLIHCRNLSQADQIKHKLQNAYHLGDIKPEIPNLIQEIVS